MGVKKNQARILADDEKKTIPPKLAKKADDISLDEAIVVDVPNEDKPVGIGFDEQNVVLSDVDFNYDQQDKSNVETDGGRSTANSSTDKRKDHDDDFDEI